jgi:putative oxidoreductase
MAIQAQLLIELMLRVWVGGWLVLYALRSSFGFFPGTGVPVQSIAGTAQYMNKFGWRPGLLWAWLSTLNNLIGGTFIALGLLLRPAALLSSILLFLSACHHLRKDGWFANQNGLEHYALWCLCTLYFTIHGAGPYSLDHFIAWPRSGVLGLL